MSYADALAPLLAPYTINNANTAAVSTDTYYCEDMSKCPIAVKVILLGAGGVGVISEYYGDPFWVGWHPMPKVKRQR